MKIPTDKELLNAALELARYPSFIDHLDEYQRAKILSLAIRLLKNEHHKHAGQLRMAKARIRFDQIGRELAEYGLGPGNARKQNGKIHCMSYAIFIYYLEATNCIIKPPYITPKNMKRVIPQWQAIVDKFRIPWKASSLAQNLKEIAGNPSNHSRHKQGALTLLQKYAEDYPDALDKFLSNENM
jgi:hypothetical protein